MSDHARKISSVKMITTRNLLSMGALIVLLLFLNFATYHMLSDSGHQKAVSAMERMQVLDGLLITMSDLQVLEGELVSAAQQKSINEAEKKASQIKEVLLQVNSELNQLRRLVAIDSGEVGTTWVNSVLRYLKIQVPDFTRYQSLKTLDILDDVYTSLEKRLTLVVGDLALKKSFAATSMQYAEYKQDVREFNQNINTLRGNFKKEVSLQHSASSQDVVFHTVLGVIILLFILVVGLISLRNRRLIGSVQLLRQTANRIYEGDFSEITAIPRDEIGAATLLISEAVGQYKEAILADADRETTQENLIGFLDVVSEAAEGDLTLKAPVTADAFGSVADAYNLMVESLADLLKETKRSADDVGIQSKYLMQIFQDLEAGALAQSTQIEKVTKAVEKSEVAAQEITEKAALAQEVSMQVDLVTAKGQDLVNDNIDGMQLIRITVQVINKKMKNLSERILEIGTISKLISDIATRTTILAMNASIEASRAGEQGRGFLVISDEIKRLADKSAEATKQINGVIKSIQTDAGEVTASLEEETKTVESQTRLAQDTGDAFNSIKDAIEKSKSVVTEISELSKAQLEITKNVDEAMLRVVEISQIAQRHVEDSSKITTGLNKQSSELLLSVDTFRLPED
ncbi:MAG: methyl-accepting chemotaxis protein [Desulfuromonadaceae bacterium]|nr:methyl-accepting chemotaxis protein [Desulfuromonas sp.]MDY0184601.1 methyl-accepting chemotaxis protein [Desulfuromonadaceae bacterium]